MIMHRKRLDWERGRSRLKANAPVRIALVYPNRYEVGMASLGFQTVYRLFNLHPDVRCERVFFETPDNRQPVLTFETGDSLNRFDLIGFSVSYELDATNVIRTLVRSGIPPLSRDRTQAHPLVFLGGAIGGLNPSPLLPFLDGLLAGEGEGIIPRIGDALCQYRRRRTMRQSRLEALAEIPGVFIPGRSVSVRRHITERLVPPPAFTPIITPFSHFSDMFVVETGRGCPKGCLFCTACKMYFPYRIHAPETVLEAVKKYNPGAEKIGLEGAGLSDYPQLIPLCRSILNAGLAVSFSSIRADRITEDFIDIIRAGRIRSFTIAPEAGSERLRSRIGKAMSHDALLEKAALLSDSGIEILKLYYLIGIPGETDQDVEALIQSVRSIGDRFLGRSKTRRVRISVNAFVPKPFTEFQWAAMMPEREILSRRKRIQDGIESEKRMVFIRKSGREETLQGLLSLGDERTGLALLDAVQNRRGIPAAFADAGVDKATLVYREKRIDEPLPWDFIEYEVPKERLWNRYRKEEHGTGCNRDGRGEADRGRHRQSPG